MGKGNPCRLAQDPRRCRERRVPGGSFTEQIGEVPDGRRTAGRLRHAISAAVGMGPAVSPRSWTCLDSYDAGFVDLRRPWPAGAGRQRTSARPPSNPRIPAGKGDQL